ncbi:MAG: hypothetical protein AAF990_14235 [Bacteroidota bacterium]
MPITFVGFALWGTNWSWLPIELLGIALYFIPAYLARRFDARWLSLGWALHVLWDVWLHQGGHPGMFRLGIRGFALAST